MARNGSFNTPLVISDNMQFYIDLTLFGGVISTICLIGVFTNVLNITVFFTQGVKDCITLTLVMLSISDLGVVICTLGFTIPFITVKYVTISDVNVMAMPWRRLVFSIRRFWMDASMTLTLFISIEKCLCVVWPFKFKGTFTLKRTAYVLVCIIICAFLFNLASFLSFRLQWVYAANRTTLVLGESGNKKETIYGSQMLHITIITISQVIVMVCTIAMIRGLHQSTKFRQSARNIPHAITNGASAGMGAKELNIVKMASVVAVVYIICNTPDIIFIYITSFVHELNAQGRYRNLFWTIISTMFFAQAINSTFNILIYYCYSSKFRAVMNRLFSPASDS